MNAHFFSFSRFASIIRLFFFRSFGFIRCLGVRWLLCSIIYAPSVLPKSIRGIHTNRHTHTRGHAYTLLYCFHSHKLNEICSSYLTGTWRMKDKMGNSVQCAFLLWFLSTTVCIWLILDILRRVLHSVLNFIRYEQSEEIISKVIVCIQYAACRYLTSISI